MARKTRKADFQRADDVAAPKKRRGRKRGPKPKKTKVDAIAPAETADEATFTSIVVMRFQDICELWAQGKSMRQVAEELGIGTGRSIWKVIHKDRALRTVLDEYRPIRAAKMYEDAIEWGYAAASCGDPKGLKVAIDAAFKVAARLDPENYADIKKLEVSGPGGRPIQTESKIELTPAEVYERMLKRA